MSITPILTAAVLSHSWGKIRTTLVSFIKLLDPILTAVALPRSWGKMRTTPVSIIKLLLDFKE